jgi:hypothetical protein
VFDEIRAKEQVRSRNSAALRPWNRSRRRPAPQASR